MSEQALERVAVRTIVEGRTTFKVYSSDSEFRKDLLGVQKEGEHRVNVLSEDSLKKFLKKYELRYDPAEIAVVSYTKIGKEQYDPFVIRILE